MTRSRHGRGKKNVLLCGDGNDSVFNYYADDSTIVGGNGNDKIETCARNATPEGSADNDTIFTYYSGVNSYSSVNGGTGNYIPRNRANSNSTFTGGEGDDSIFSHRIGDGELTLAHNVLLDGGNGNDTLWSGGGKNATLLGGEGNDFLNVRADADHPADNALIEGGNGDDDIFLEGSHSTLTGGVGDDYIESWGNNNAIDGGNGNNIIRSQGANVTIKTGAGNDSVCNNGIWDANGNVSFADHASIDLGDGDDSLAQWQGTRYATVRGGASNDHMFNFGAGGSIDGGDGNDSIDNAWLASLSAVDGGAGNDTIRNYSDYVTVNGGADDDRIENDAEHVSINGGSGNDHIENYSEYATIRSGDGDDSIFNYRFIEEYEEDEGGAEGDEENHRFVEDTDVLVVMSGAYSSLNGGAGLDFIFNDARSVIVNAETGNDIISLGSNHFNNVIQFKNDDGHETVCGYNITDSIDITDGSPYNTLASGRNMIVSLASGSITLVDVLGIPIDVTPVDGKDYTVNNDDNSSVNTGEDDDYIENHGAGSTLDGGSDNDYICNTAARVSIDAGRGNDTIVNSGEGAQNVTMHGSKDNDLIMIVDPYNRSISQHNLITYTSGDGNDTVTGFGESDSIKLSGVSKVDISTIDSDILISVDGGSILLKNAAAYDLNYNSSTGILAIAEIDTTPVTTPADNYDTVNYINTKDNVRVFPPFDDDFPTNYGIANTGENVTIQTGAGNDSITGSDEFGEVIVFNAFGGKDVFTNFAINDSIVVDTAFGSITSTYAKGNDYIINVGEGTLTLKDAAVFADTFKQSSVKGGQMLTVDGINRIVNRADKKKVNGTGGRDYIINYGNKATLNGKGGDDTPVGSNLYGELYLFAATYGNDEVRNFGSNDTLKITSGDIQSAMKLGNDFVITVKNSKNSGANTLRDAGSLHFKQNGSVFTVDQSNYIINRDDNVKVSGTSKADYITNSGENVSIQPGKGNDTIEGSSFGELYLFAYNHGNNIITNFGANDTLKCTNGSIENIATVGADIVVTLTGSGKNAVVTLKNISNYPVKQNGNVLTVDMPNYISNAEDKLKLVGTRGRDWIVNTGEKVTVQSGGGDDTLTGSDEYGEVYLFAATDGNNRITDLGKNDTVSITSGSIVSSEQNGADYIVTVSGATASGTITLGGAATYDLIQSGNSLTIDRINRIDNSTDMVKVTGTDGRDYITNSGSKVTIASGKGDDTIEGSSFAETYLFAYTGGDNIITNFGSNDTLIATSGNLSFETVGSDVIVSITKSKTTSTITLQGAANLPSSLLGVHDSYVITQSGNCLYAEHSISPDNYWDNVKYVGTPMRDYMINHGRNVTILSGAGNDTIVGSDLYGEVIQFASDGGSDLVTNFGKSDSLQIVGGSIQSTMKSGDNYIVNVKSNIYGGTITLGGTNGYVFEEVTDARGTFLTVEDINYIISPPNTRKITGTSKADYITISDPCMSVQSGKGNDTIEGSNFGDVYMFAYNHGSNVITNFGMNDTLTATSGTLTYKQSGDDMLVTITKGKTKSTVRLLGAANIPLTVEGNVLQSSGFNIIDNAEDGKKITGKSANGKRDYITSNIITNFRAGDSLVGTNGTSMSYKTNGENVIVTVKGSKTATVTLEGAADLNFSLEKKDSILTAVGVNEIVNGYDDLKITGTGGRDYIINSGRGVSIASGKGNDTIEGSIFGETFLFAQTDGANVITNFGVNDTLKATSGTLSTQKSGDDMIVSITKSKKTATVTLQSAGNYDFTMSGTSMVVVGINEIENTDDKKKITGTSKADLIINTGEKVTVQPGKGNDTIIGSDLYGELYQFAYTGGKNVITNFSVGDTLQVTSGTLTYQKSGTDYVVTIASGTKKSTVTLEGAVDLGTIQQSKNGKSIILQTIGTIVMNELPPSAEDYWFEQDSATDEIEELLASEPIGNALGMIDDPNSAMSVGSAQKDELLMVIARHRQSDK